MSGFRRVLARSLALTATAAAASASLSGAASAALLPQTPETRTRPVPSVGAMCPLDLGAADVLVWLRFDLFKRHARSDVVATSLAPRDGIPPLEPARGFGSCPVGAATTDGSALIGYTRPDRDRYTGDDRIVVAERPAGGPVSRATALPGARGSAPAIAFAPGGAAAIAWLAPVPGPDTTALYDDGVVPMVATRKAGGDFAPPVALGKPFFSSEIGAPEDVPDVDRLLGPTAGVDGAGNALVVWVVPSVRRAGDSPGPESLELWTAERHSSGSFSAPRPLGRLSSIDALHLAVASTGEALLVIDGGDGVRIATGTAADGLGAPTLVSGLVAGRSAVAIAPGGAAVVTWAQGGEGRRRGAYLDRVVAVERPSGAAAFGAPATLATWSRRSPEQVPPTAVALSADGRTLGLWRERSRTLDRLEIDRVRIAQGRLGGDWEPAVETGAPCRVVTDALPAFGRDGSPRVTLVDASMMGGGDSEIPVDGRVRVVRLGPQPPADTTAPRATLTARRRQPLRNSFEGRVRLRLRCSEACDAHVFAIVNGKRDRRAGLYPEYPRLGAGRSRALALHRSSPYYDDSDRFREDRTTPVRLVAHVCDAAGNVGRATTTVLMPVRSHPSTPPGLAPSPAR